MLNISKIDIGSNFSLEISYHYGIKKFEKIGCFLFNCISRKYAKKIIVVLPNQKHPSHFHKLKEETFQILNGKLFLKIEKKDLILFPGETITVMPGVWHSFYAKNEGCIFEEVSTTLHKNDSFYYDEKISSKKPHERKTKVSNWGRYELKNVL